MSELPIGQMLRDLRLDNEALKRQLDEARAQNVWCSRYAWGAFDALRARVAELEEMIIEADAAYNTDHKHMPIEAAELALVTMAYQGSEALTENATLRARVAELEALIIKMQSADNSQESLDAAAASGALIYLDGPEVEE